MPVSFLSHRLMAPSRESVIFVDVFCLEHDLTHCEVYWALDFDPFENEWRAMPVALGGSGVWLGGYFLARLIILILLTFAVFYERFLA